nr:TRAP transporter substrate-binding protein [Halalkalibacter oceani]
MVESYHKNQKRRVKTVKKSLLILVALLTAVCIGLAACGGEDTAALDTSGGTGGGENGEASAGEEESFEFNIGHTLAPDSHYHVVSERLAELVEEKTGGSITMNVFPQSQLGGEVAMIQAAQAGNQEMLITAQAPLTNMVPEWSMFDLPYLFDNLDEANAILQSEVGDQYLEMLEEHDLIGLGFLSAMERNVFSSKPLDTADDFNGFRVRVMEAPGYVAAYEALGAQPTAMAYSEVYTALQQGVVDGADTSPDQFVMDRFVEVADYYNITKVHYLPATLIISKTIWEQLSENQQQALTEAAEEALAEGMDYYYQSFDESIAEMQEAGVTVIESDTAGMQEQASAIYDDLLNGIPNGQELYEAIQAQKE